MSQDSDKARQERTAQKEKDEFLKLLPGWVKQKSIVGASVKPPPQSLWGTLVQQIMVHAVSAGKRWAEAELQLLLSWNMLDLGGVADDEAKLKRVKAEGDAINRQMAAARNVDVDEIRKEYEKRLAKLEARLLTELEKRQHGA